MTPLLRIITPEQYQTSPWKNGGGITHEITRKAVGDSWEWRLSIAEVASDGPFSHFPGMSRILTVIEGEGIDLHSPYGIQKARLNQPILFSGDLDVNSTLVSGAIRDFNLIYDSKVVSAVVQVLSGPGKIDTTDATTGFLCLSGSVSASNQPVPVGAFALTTDADITLGTDAHGILLTLRDLT